MREDSYPELLIFNNENENESIKRQAVYWDNSIRDQLDHMNHCLRSTSYQGHINGNHDEV